MPHKQHASAANLLQRRVAIGYFLSVYISTQPQELLVDGVVDVFIDVEDHADAGFPAGFNGYLGGTTFGEMEIAGGDTAEGNAMAVVLPGKPQAASVASGQLFLLPHSRDTVLNDRSHSVDDIFRWQVISRSDDGTTRGNPFTLKNVVALLSKLQARCGVDIIVDTGMEGIPTTKTAGIGGIDYRIDLESRDIALPQSLASPNHSFTF